MIRLISALQLLFVYSILTTAPAAAQSWTADNGNGTYTNPLFYDEFSDPDLIRVNNDFYITGTPCIAYRACRCCTLPIW